MRFLSIGSPVSASLPPPGRLPFRSWLHVVVLSCFHVRSSYRGLAPHLQRAHAGRTQHRGLVSVKPRRFASRFHRTVTTVDDPARCARRIAALTSFRIRVKGMMTMINGVRGMTLLLALSGSLLSSSSRADIVHTSTNVVCIGADVLLDIDADGTNDFRFINPIHLIPGCKSAMLEQLPNSLIHVSTNGNNGAPLPLGYHLESPSVASHLWLTPRDVAIQLFYGCADSIEEVAYSGSWASVTNQCVGVALRKGDAYLCGWILLTIDSGIVYLHGYAHEETPDLPIYARRTSSYPRFTAISCSESNTVLQVDNLIPGEAFTIQETRYLNSPAWSSSTGLVAQGLNATVVIPVTNDLPSILFSAVIHVP